MIEYAGLLDRAMAQQVHLEGVCGLSMAEEVCSIGKLINMSSMGSIQFNY